MTAWKIPRTRPILRFSTDERTERMSQRLRKPSLYDEDFYTWTNEQAALLRAGRFEQVDVANLIEEIETLGRSEASSLRSSMRLVVMHSLKMIHRPERATNSWRATVARERDKMGQILLDDPGLKSRLPELYDQAYQAARREAIAETGLGQHRFSQQHELTLDQIQNERFMPWTPTFGLTALSPPVTQDIDHDGDQEG